RRTTSEGPAWPVPMTIASNLVGMVVSPLLPEPSARSSGAAVADVRDHTLTVPRMKLPAPGRRETIAGAFASWFAAWKALLLAFADDRESLSSRRGDKCRHPVSI